MENPTATTFFRLPRRLAIIGGATLAALALLYALGGFVLLPWYAQRELPRLAAQHLHHQAHAGAISFNPFTLTLQVKDFAL